MIDYRIHKTEQGYYKVQMKRAAIKFFGITIRRERFISSVFYPFSHEINIFDTKEEAQEAMNKLIASDNAVENGLKYLKERKIKNGRV